MTLPNSTTKNGSGHRRRNAFVIAGFVGFLALAFWLTDLGGDPARRIPLSSMPDNSQQVDIAASTNDQASARSLAHLTREKQRSWSDRLKGLREEIDSAEEPGAVFMELADLITSERDPVKRSVLVGDIGNALVDFASPSEGLAWLNKYEKYFLENFENIGSGKDGTLSPEGGFTVLKSIVGGFDLKLRLRDGHSEFIEACLAVPVSEMKESKIMLDVFARAAMQAKDFSIAESNLDDDLKQRLYKSALLQVNPQGVFQVKKYLSGEYLDFRDEGNRVVEELVNEAWYIENESKIDDLISGSEAGPSRDRFLSTLVVRSIKLRDGNAEKYLEQIQDEEIRRSVSSEIERGG
jgi:hypothetical protein